MCSPVSSTVQMAMGLIKKAIAVTKITKVQTKVPQQGNPKMEQRVGKNPRKNSRGLWRWPHCHCHFSKAVHLHLIIKKSKIVPMVQAGKFLPWVNSIHWCEGHWCGSIYMAMRLSDISSKTGKKCIFGVFRLFLSFCWTASQLYRLSQTNALRINQFY